MFQYALYKNLKKANTDVRLDVMTYYGTEHPHNISHNIFRLDGIFGAGIDYADSGDIAAFGGGATLLSKLVSVPIRAAKFRSLSMFRDGDRVIYRRGNANRVKYVFSYLGSIGERAQTGDVCFDGYWGNYRYAENVRDDILRDFTFIQPLDPENARIRDEIQSCASVSVHIRRGDYLEKRHGFLNLCNEDYYANAIRHIEKKVGSPVYFVFSDDIGWVRDNLKPLRGREAVFIGHNTGADSYKDMQLISCCKHNITANSTFSWWGAYLNGNEGKTVLAPYKFFNKALQPNCGWDMYYDGVMRVGFKK
jgi:hypothetical protein